VVTTLSMYMPKAFAIVIACISATCGSTPSLTNL
jgi:hypothetical protein